MNRFIKYYLIFLPIFSLFGILASISRTVYQDSYVLEFLIISAILDFMIIALGFKYTLTKQITILLCLLFVSTIVGLLNNEVSRRFVTDFTTPFFFFAKVFVFARYWDYTSFKDYIRFYTRFSFWGSLALLPVTYFIFNSTGTTRLAIFPPMELPFSNYMLSSSLMLLASFIIILLYGKRAQLFSAVITFVLYISVFRRKDLFKYIIILGIASAILIPVFIKNSDNIAIRRLTATFDSYSGKGTDKENLDRISAGRFNEFETIINQMKPQDYFLGKGLGFTYDVDTGGKDSVETANAHFSPIGFLSKYGIFFTLFVYYFIMSIFFKSNKVLLSDSDYLIALGVSIFIFMESFFAYALFVTPILPIVLGVLISNQKKQRKAAILKRRNRVLVQQPQPGQVAF
jgi:hypothetical protein